MALSRSRAGAHTTHVAQPRRRAASETSTAFEDSGRRLKTDIFTRYAGDPEASRGQVELQAHRGQVPQDEIFFFSDPESASPG